MDIIRANLGHPQTRSHSTQFNTVGFPAFFASFNFVVVPKLFLSASPNCSSIREVAEQLPFFCFWMKTEQKTAKNAKTQLNML